MWQQWVNVVLGLWVLLVPFLNLADQVEVWMLVLSGGLVALLGLWGALGKGGGAQSGGGV